MSNGISSLNPWWTRALVRHIVAIGFTAVAPASDARKGSTCPGLMYTPRPIRSSSPASTIRYTSSLRRPAARAESSVRTVMAAPLTVYRCSLAVYG